MKRCKLCGRLKKEADFEGSYCGRCEKVQIDVMEGLKAELCG
jgi:hypothetical protein